MMAFGKRMDLPGGRRRARREPVVLAAAAVTLDHSQSVTIEDVCSTGARLRGRGLPPDGHEMLVSVGPIKVMASVAWSANDSCGISFENVLDAAAVERIKSEGRLARILGVD